MPWPWIKTAAIALTYCIFVPLALGAYANILFRMITRSQPWRQGRIFPLLKRKARIDEEFIKRRSRQAVAVCRAYGSPLRTPLKEIRDEYRQARIRRDALSTFTLFGSLTAPALFLAIAALAALTLDTPRGMSQETVKVASKLFAALLAIAVIQFRFADLSSQWRRQNSDAEAIASCVFILYLLTHRRVDPLDIEDAVDDLCDELSDFANSNTVLNNSARQAEVSRHVGQVQQELRCVSGKILSGGVAEIPGLVRSVGTVLERVIEQRWLCLLDLPDTAGVSPSARASHLPDWKSDAWIVVGGSLAAAIGLGVATMSGVPLSAAVPATLVFLLGPAALWGSRRLGVSPRGLLDSVKASVEGSGRSGSQQPSGPEASGDPAGQGQSQGSSV
ncbi:hypothetical protein [Streptomyces sp. NPDC001020]